MKKAIIILADGFEEMEAITPTDLLRRADIEVFVAGLGKKEICGSHGVKVIADEIFDAEKHTGFDAIILPGGPGVANLMNDESVLKAVKNYFAAEKLCCAICAAPKVLDKAGVLKNKTYTCFPSVEKEISSGEHCDDAAVADGNVITGKAAGTAIDFSYVIIENLLSEEAAQSVIDKIYY